ncbi:hypothetical protein ACHAXT_007562 [Thalassiosira profunda]
MHRKFSRSSDDNAGTPREQARTFLVSIGYSAAVSDGVLDALLQNGIPASSLLSMTRSLAGRYEVGEDGGLEDLAASVQKELEKVEGMATVKVWCLPYTGWSPAPDTAEDSDSDSDSDSDGDNQLPVVHSMDRAFAVEATEGTTLTDVAKFGTSDNCQVLGEYLECACSGIMACSTCHVVVHPDWYEADCSTPDNGDDSDSDADRPCPPNKIGPPCEAEQDMLDLAYEPQLTSRLGCQIKLTKELDGLVVLLPGGSNNLMDFVPFDG